jgi:hypothetical protein
LSPPKVAMLTRLIRKSGNPSGRPKGRKNEATELKEILFEKIRIVLEGKPRRLSKIAVATMVCLNKAMKGDIRSFVKIIEIADRFGILKIAPEKFAVRSVRRIIVSPDGTETIYGKGN